MPITFGCPSCGKLLRVPDALAGKSVRCPHCQGVVGAPDDIPIAPVVESPLPAPPPLPDPPPPPAPPPPLRPQPADEVRKKRPERAGTARLFAAHDEWLRFGSGCRVVGLGIWIEFVAFMAVILFLLYAGLIASDDSRRRSGLPVAGAAIAVVLFAAGLMVSSVVTAVGRFRMCALPRGTGAGGILVVGSVLVSLRPLLLVGCGYFTITTVNDPTAYTGQASAMLGAAILTGWLTDVAMLPAMGIVGGMVASDRLRRAVGRLVLYMLVAMVGWSGLIGVLQAINDGNLSDSFETLAPNRRAMAQASSVVVAVGLVALFVCYTILHQAVYQAGRETAATGGPTDLE